MGEQETAGRGSGRWQRQPPRGAGHQRHHAVAVDGAVHLPVGGQTPVARHGAAAHAALAGRAVAALGPPRHEERSAPAVVPARPLLQRAVLVVGEVVLRAGVAGPPPEAEEAGAAVAARREERAPDAEQGLWAVEVVIVVGGGEVHRKGGEVVGCKIVSE